MTNHLSRSLAVCALLAAAVCPLAAAADGAAERAGRGLAAMAVPFLEVPGNIVNTDRREGPAEAWTEGLARGIGMSIIRPPIGFYELVTAPFLAGDPPVLRPDYPWTYFEREVGEPSLAHR